VDIDAHPGRASALKIGRQIVELTPTSGCPASADIPVTPPADLPPVNGEAYVAMAGALPIA